MTFRHGSAEKRGLAYYMAIARDEDRADAEDSLSYDTTSKKRKKGKDHVHNKRTERIDGPSVPRSDLTEDEQISLLQCCIDSSVAHGDSSFWKHVTEQFNEREKILLTSAQQTAQESIAVFVQREKTRAARLERELLERLCAMVHRDNMMQTMSKKRPLPETLPPSRRSDVVVRAVDRIHMERRQEVDHYLETLANLSGIAKAIVPNLGEAWAASPTNAAADLKDDEANERAAEISETISGIIDDLTNDIDDLSTTIHQIMRIVKSQHK